MKPLRGRRAVLPGSLTVMLLLCAAPALAQEVKAERAPVARPPDDKPQRCARPTAPKEGIKPFCVQLSKAVDLTLGGELRERVETIRNPGFGIVQSSDTVALHRATASADLKVGSTLRAFVQLGAFGYTGRNAGRQPFDLDQLDLAQGFVDVSASVAAGTATMRFGRQELTFGSSRLVGVRDGPNVRRAFDGARLFWKHGGVRLDAFLLRPVTIKTGLFDDATNHAERFWGVYATTPLAGPLTADLYFLTLDRDRARFAVGAAAEHRRSFGLRLFGTSSGFDWDWEGVYQSGSFGTQRISAWTIATDTGFTWERLPLRPRLGLKADIASGDANPGDRTLGTFNALYPKLPYFSEANLIAPANVMDLHPSIAVRPSATLKLTTEWNGLWRHRTGDAVYVPPLNPLGAAAPGGKRFIGHQAIIGADWRITRQLTFASQYVHFTPGGAVRDAGGRAVDFLVFSLSSKF